MTDSPTEAAHNLNADPEALAWARAKVERVRDKCRRFEADARNQGRTESATQWRRFAKFLEMEFIGGKGCVIAAFDERRPAFAALEAPVPVSEEQTGGGDA